MLFLLIVLVCFKPCDWALALGLMSSETLLDGVLQLRAFASELLQVPFHALRGLWLFLLCLLMLFFLDELGLEAIVELLHELLTLHSFVLEVRNDFLV